MLRELVSRGPGRGGLLLNLRTGRIEKRPPREQPGSPGDAGSLVAPEDVPGNERASPSASSGGGSARLANRSPRRTTLPGGHGYGASGGAKYVKMCGAGGGKGVQDAGSPVKAVHGARAKAGFRNGRASGRANGARTKAAAQPSSGSSDEATSKASSSDEATSTARSSSSTASSAPKLPGPRNALETERESAKGDRKQRKDADSGAGRKCGKNGKRGTRKPKDAGGKQVAKGESKRTADESKRRAAGAPTKKARKAGGKAAPQPQAAAPETPRLPSVVLAKMGETCCEVLLKRLEGAREAATPIGATWDMSQRTSVERCRLHLAEVGGLAGRNGAGAPVAILWKVKEAKTKDAESLAELGKYLINKGRVGLVENAAAQIYLIPPHGPFQHALGVDEPGSMLAVHAPRVTGAA